MQFSQVIGQAELKAQLVHMVQHNRLSHALLFLGKEGSGALSLARAMAQYTVCETVNGKAQPTPKSPEAPSLFGDPEPETKNDQRETRNEKREKRETRNEQRTLIPAVPAHPALKHLNLFTPIYIFPFR